jgi:pimeloyl-ACP methyl ester carboxylesterase
MSSAARVRDVSAGGIAYGRRGNGPPVVLLHGWCLNRDLWIYEEERLRSQYTAITPDLPGFGGSAGLAGPYDLERYVSAVRGLLTELSLEDVTIVGFAFGAAIAMALAAADDSGIAGLVLIGVPSAASAAYDRMPRAMRRDWPDFARRSAEAICKVPHSEATLDWLSHMFRSAPLPTALETVGLLGRFEPGELAASVHVRSLFVHGEDDDVVPIEVARACAELMPDAQVSAVPACGHLVPIDRPTEFGELVSGFLAG